MSDSSPAARPHAAKRKYVPAVGPRLRILLYVVFALVALLGANSVYLAAITGLEWASAQWGDGLTYQNYFYLVMFGLHLVLGMMLIIPFLMFGTMHLLATRKRKNRRAVRMGYALFSTSILLLVSGVLLVRIEGLFELKNAVSRSVVYWLHVICPIAAIWLYWLHRLAGPPIKWRVGLTYVGAVAAVVIGMVILQAQDPRDWYAEAPKEGDKYFEPSLTRTRDGTLVSARALMMDDYCLKCHADAYQGWFHSVHHFSSFNNPAYLASILESREMMLKRDGDVKASRWCAGCHDPVPFLSGAFDDPNYDVVNDPTAHAGITCTVCHAITHVNSVRGNGDYVLEEPLHYPFAYSDNALLQLVNNTLVKAKPSFHKQTFLKPFHKTTEFCSVCHKVHLPEAVTHYRAFLRGQNHYDAFLLSGVSGIGARSFYYPPKSKQNCNECHMPLLESSDFAARPALGRSGTFIHDHTFPSANTAVAWWRGLDDVVEQHRKFNDGVMRVDLFGIRDGATIDAPLISPLRPRVPTLDPGRHYLLETVIRTVKMGHLFTQGTVDSNEIWLDISVTSGGRTIGRSGGMDANREVDRFAHFVNVFMLDRDGNRIARRNAQDIFVPLYNHQIPPGAAQTVHYELALPEQLDAPVTVTVELNYRKFDKEYTDFVAERHPPEKEPLRGSRPGEPYINNLPIIVLAEDTITFPVTGVDADVSNPERPIAAWERINDYGIGLLLSGTAQLRQARETFARVEEMGRYDGALNLARALVREGQNDLAVETLKRAAVFDDPPAPWWTVAWLSGVVNRNQGHLAEAEKDFRSVLEKRTPGMLERGFDFSRDYVVINDLGLTLYAQALQELAVERHEPAERLLHDAEVQFQRTLAVDPENVTAHYNLQRIYALLDDEERSERHRELHERYKPDDNARDRAVAAARRKYQAANHAAEALVIYSLHRTGAPTGPSLDNPPQRAEKPGNQGENQP